MERKSEKKRLRFFVFFSFVDFCYGNSVSCDFILIHNDKRKYCFRSGLFINDPITRFVTKFICLMASSVSRSISSGSTRHVHYQSQISNASLSLSQTFSAAELSNLNESHSSLLQNSNPLVTIIYSTMSLTIGMLQ